ncbi:MAG: fibrobacter succinogenes major paralogous domain-containing protein [bacterium]
MLIKLPKQFNIQKTLSYLLIVFVLFVFGNWRSEAAFSSLYNFSGRVTDVSNTLVPNGTYDFSFAYYTAPTGGTAVWSENLNASSTFSGLVAAVSSTIDTNIYTFANELATSTLRVGQSLNDATSGTNATIIDIDLVAKNITVTKGGVPFNVGDSINNRPRIDNGYVNVNLGAVSDMSGVSFDQDLYLEVVVNGETLKPRKLIPASAQAFNATRLAGLFATEYLSLSSDTWQFNNPVNIATSSVAAALTVNKTATGQVVDFQASGNTAFTVLANGNVGIGTSTPGSMLSVGSSTGSQFLVNNSGIVLDGTWQGDAISNLYGGTGQDSTGWTGFVFVTDGVWTATGTLPSGSLPANLVYIGNNISKLVNNVGYITATSTDTLTNKSGNISMWTNNAGYLLPANIANFITATSSNTLTNKTGNISMWTNDAGYLTSGGNYITATSSDILTNKTWNGVVIGSTYGGTGQDMSAATGLAMITGGVWSASSTINDSLITNGLTIDSTGSIDAAAIKSGYLATTRGGTGTSTNTWSGLAFINNGVWQQVATSSLALAITDTTGNLPVARLTGLGSLALRNNIDLASSTLTNGILGVANGGLGTTSTAWTGYAFVSGGNWTATNTIPGSALPGNLVYTADNISVLTNNVGYISSTSIANFITATSSNTLTNKSGNISMWTNDLSYITDGNANWDNLYGLITATSTDTLTNKSGNISMWTNNAGYLLPANIANFITATSSNTLTNKTGNISMWTNDAGYLTSGGNYITATSSDILTNKTWNGVVIGSTYGGTGQDMSAATGLAMITGGVWSASSTINDSLITNGLTIDSTGSIDAAAIKSGYLATTRGGTGTSTNTWSGLAFINNGVWQQVATSSLGNWSQWSSSSSDVYFNTGNVGIGTDNPQEKLHVAGNALIDNALYLGSKTVLNGYNTRLNVVGDGLGYTSIFDSAGTQNYNIFHTNDGGWGEYGMSGEFGSNNKNLYFQAVSANTAMNFGQVTGMNLSILPNKNIVIGDSIVDNDGTGGLFIFDNMNGNFGIGTNTPTQKLHVAGGLRLEGGLYDGDNSIGLPGQVLLSTGDKVLWTSTSSLGIVGGGSSQWTTNGSNISYATGNISIGTTSASSMLTIGATSSAQFLVNGTGVVTSGAWNGSAIGVTYGGTGTTTTPMNGGLLIGNGSGYSVGTLTAGSGMNVLNATGSILVTNIGVLSASGTAAQIIVSSNTGNIQFSLPQDIANTSAPTFGGLSVSNLTSGSILFAGTGGLLSQDNANYFWDDTNNRLGIGTNLPGDALDIFGAGSGLRLSYDNSHQVTLSSNSNGELNISSTASSSGSSIMIGNGLNRDIILGFDASTTDYHLGVDSVDGNFKIGAGTSFAANNFLIVDATGKVGVGTTSGGAMLSLIGSGSNQLFNVLSSSSVSVFNISANGNIGVGTTTDAHKFTVDGSLYATDIYTSSSTFWMEGKRVLSLGTGLSLYNPSNSYSSSFKASTGLTSDLTWFLPSTIGQAGQVMTNDGSGNMYWSTLASSSSQWVTRGSDIYFASSTGGIAIGTSTISSMLTVGSTATQQFLVNSAGVVVGGTWQAGAIENTYIASSSYWKGYNNFSNTVTGLTYNNVTGQTSLTAGYNIPLSASTTAWENKVSSQWTTNGSNITYATGNIAIGTTTTNSMLTIGATTSLQFLVNNTGVVTAGTWNAGAIGVAYGGTGTTTTPMNGGLLIGNGTSYVVGTLMASSGISIVNATGSIVITNSGVLTATGTAAQINVSSHTGNIQFSLPQDIANTSTPAFGGLSISNLTSGSMLFAGTGGLLSQDNANYFWDDTNNRLGIGTNLPGDALDIFGAGSGLKLSYDNSHQVTLSSNSNGELNISSSASTTGSGVTLGNGLDRNILMTFDASTTDYHLGVDSTDNVFKFGSGIVFGTNDYLVINSVGNIGIGTSTPVVMLDVNGEIKIGNTLVGCDIATEGAMRYNSEKRLVEHCDGNEWDSFVCGNQIFDVEGNAYNTVSIGRQCWTKENLMTTRYPNGTPITRGPVDATWNMNDNAYYAYPPNATNDAEETLASIKENKLGFVYQWSAAMDGSNASTAQGICPNGWHIPSHDEITAMERIICTSGTCATDFPLDAVTTGALGTDEGSKLSLETLNGNNSSNFTFKLSGVRHSDGSFAFRNDRQRVWSSTENGADAWTRSLYSSDTTITRDMNSKAEAFVVRCMKN